MKKKRKYTRHSKKGGVVKFLSKEIKYNKIIGGLKSSITKYEKKYGVELNRDLIFKELPTKTKSLSDKYFEKLQKKIDIIKAGYKRYKVINYKQVLDNLINNWLNEFHSEVGRRINPDIANPFIDELINIFTISKMQDEEAFYTNLDKNQDKISRLIDKLLINLYNDQRKDDDRTSEIYATMAKISELMDVEYELYFGVGEISEIEFRISELL